MSFFDPIVDEAFTVRIVKHHASNPSLSWENLYEFRNRTAVNSADLVLAGRDIVDFELAIHYNFVVIEYFTVSTWVPDGQPYNPDSFVSTPVNSAGEREPAGEPLGLVACMRMQSQVESGRMGFHLYRGCLAENDVVAPAGITVLSNPGSINLVVAEAKADHLSHFLGVADGIVQLVMESTNSSRRITDYNAVGVSYKKLNNKYFNRTRP